jgi:hypothetical protein
MEWVPDCPERCPTQEQDRREPLYLRWLGWDDITTVSSSWRCS